MYYSFSHGFRIAAALSLIAGGIQANSFYASPTGNSAGNGSFSAPWDLQTALSGATGVQPGDSIWLRGGTYISTNPSGFTSRLRGSSEHSINIRNYQGEQATIDRHGTTVGLAIYGGYASFTGLSIIDSTAPSSLPNSAYIEVFGSGIKCISMVVNKTAMGFTSSSYNREILVSTAVAATGAPLSGSVSLVATASASSGVSGVQFQVDGVNLGYKVTQQPYTITWNTTTASNANHTITAIASDGNGNKATASEVVPVKNGP